MAGKQTIGEHMLLLYGKILVIMIEVNVPVSATLILQRFLFQAIRVIRPRVESGPVSVEVRGQVFDLRLKAYLLRSMVLNMVVTRGRKRCCI